MIDVIKRTPEEYSKQSRDYQVLARLYSALFNVSKMYIDDMNIWDKNIDNKLSLLRARTLNFDPQHDWDLDSLDVIVSCFKYLIKYKGTKNALKYIINVMMKIRKIDDDIDESTVTIENNNITIRLEDDLVTLGIIDDIIKYILPAGYTYRIIEYKSYDLSDVLVTEAEVGDSVSEPKKVNKDYRMYIGNDENKKRLLRNTYIYNDDDMKHGVDIDSNGFIRDYDSSDVEGDGTAISDYRTER